MAKMIIATESGSDIPAHIAEQHNIQIIPMHVVFGDEYKKDGTFPVSDVIDYYEKNGKVPKTSATNPSEFDAFYTDIHNRYPEHHIIYMAYSGQTTSTFANGCIAAQEHPYVTCLDTKQCSAGQSAAITMTAEAFEANPDWTVEECVKEAERICSTVHMCFLPANLDFLHAGGRCSGVAAFAGSILQIHPLVDIQDGLLKVGKKYRGTFKKLIPKVMENYMEQYKLEKERIWFAWTEGLGEELKELLCTTAKKMGVKEFSFVKCGGVITCHGGPGAFGVIGYHREG